MDNNELYHHGVKGMQWGKRLYQNKDGSLTAMGKARYAIKQRSAAKKRQETIKAKRKTALAEQKMLQEKYKKEAKELKRESKLLGKKVKRPEDGTLKKSVRDMSDDELRRAIDRARMEDTYKQLRPEAQKKSSTFIKGLFNDVVGPAAKNAGRQFLEDAMKKYGADLLKDAVDPNSLAGLTQTRDKLKLKKEIDDLKKNKEPELSWADKLKKQTWEKNEREMRKAESETPQENSTPGSTKKEAPSNRSKQEAKSKTSVSDIMSKIAKDDSIAKGVSVPVKVSDMTFDEYVQYVSAADRLKKKR